MIRPARSSTIAAFYCTLGFLAYLGLQIGERPADAAGQQPVLTGQDAFTDAAHESPGIRRHLIVADLPAPAQQESVDNGPTLVPRPESVLPIAPKGFKVALYATGLDNPRLLRTAPNDDLFLAESETGKIKIFRGIGPDGKAKQLSVFAEGLHQPFGIAFYPAGPHPAWVYIGNTDGIVRFPYKNGDLTARGAAEHLADLPGGGRLRGGGHWTRDVVFSKDGTKLFASVGSHSNVDDADTHPEEFHRADVLEFTPEGKFVKIYASGLRNCVGEAINPITGELW
jgi:glucose/arabinose dehydrogenase